MFRLEHRKQIPWKHKLVIIPMAISLYHEMLRPDERVKKGESFYLQRLLKYIIVTPEGMDLLSSEQHIPQVCPRWSKLTASVDVVKDFRRLSKSTSFHWGTRCTCDAIDSFHFLLLSVWAVVPSPTHSLGLFLHWHIYIAIEVLIKPFPR